MARVTLSLGGLVAAAMGLASLPTFASANVSTVAQGCSDLIAERTQKADPRLVTATDLVSLRDIGPVSNSDVSAAILSLSPDGSKVAFQLRRADAQQNLYCLGMFVLSLKPGAQPIEVDAGGDYILSAYSALGFASMSSGSMTPTITPKWSPDGQWIAYLRRDQGVTQVWRAYAGGGLSGPITRLANDAEDFAWTPDGLSVVVSGRPGLQKARDDIVIQGASGYLYDDGFTPNVSSLPQPREPIEAKILTVAISDGAMREATDQEKALLAPRVISGLPSHAGLAQVSSKGLVAWTQVKDPANIVSEAALYVKSPGGGTGVCSQAICTGILNLWWMADGTSLVFQRGGWRAQNTALYRWKLGESEPSKIVSTDDVLIGCQPSRDALICGHEASLQPRHLVRIDLESGAISNLFDPNPEFLHLRLGTVKRLHWTTTSGITTFGDLVLPPDYRSGQKLPLILVQYESQGFLRGGTGDEYPIQLLAAHGFAVLSFQKPVSAVMLKGARSWDEFNSLNRLDWRERRDIQSSLDLGIDAAIATGVVDAKRIGLTGLSDGASTAQFSLVNSHRLAAVAVSTCCDERDTMAELIGPAAARWFHAMGYPGLTEANDHFWNPVSLTLNAARVNTPILMQLSDHEYLNALESVTALKEQGKAVEIYVFPDEFHIKWQPAHRLAIYERAIDWFDFWLKDEEDPNPSKREQFKRWEGLRLLRLQNMGATPGY